MTLFGHYEVDSWLRRRNPTAKLAAHLVLSLLLTAVFDPLTPLTFLVAALALGRLGARIPVRLFLTALAPVALLGASLVLSYALFATGSRSAWGPFAVTAQGAIIGLSLAERGVAIAAFTLVFVLSTDPTSLVRSLVQQARLPAHIAYPALAAYRFLPLLQDDYETIRLARRLRGQGRQRGPLAALRERVDLLVPLLVGAIRRAERVAVAMDSRGFAARRPRTHYRLTPFEAADAWMLAGTVALGGGLLALSATLGSLRLWLGGFPT
ncbi:MAG TPA: energy-coupling factor transporter transmembrane component T [Chloroflexota bacterium]|nr:energy-coupling factor transporter transmembrane component T [Chloroflexota bacterium]